MYSSTLSVTSALGEGWVMKSHAPTVLPPGKMRYPLYRRLGGTQGLFGVVQKISYSSSIRSPDGPARSGSLYRLSYSGPPKNIQGNIN
jgi:hypothetical protein